MGEYFLFDLLVGSIIQEIFVHSSYICLDQTRVHEFISKEDVHVV